MQDLPYINYPTMATTIVTSIHKERRKIREMASSIATRWRELSGEKNWENLMQPLDPDLCRYIIHYGSKAAAAGDLFDSRNDGCGASKEEFFSKASIVKGNPYKYDVSHFLYACSNIVGSSWFGYVAVSTDEAKHILGRRDILVAWRGTVNYSEWIADACIAKTTPSDLFPNAIANNAAVHTGFLSLYTGTKSDSTHNKISAREQVLHSVRELVNKYKDEEISITITGFSLGAALATLTAMDIVANGYNKPTIGDRNKSVMVTAFVYGCPRIGNDGLATVFDALDRDHHLRLLRIKNEMDPVTMSPPLMMSYTHFGNELIVDTSNSTFLKKELLGRRRGNISFPDEDDCIDIRSSYEDVHEVKGENGDTYEHIDDINSPDKDKDELEPEPKRAKRCFSINNEVSAHNIDVYMHGVAIKYMEHPTVDTLEHDLALVNRYLDRVEKEYGIPTNWWAAKNRKKMVQLENGRWKLAWVG